MREWAPQLAYVSGERIGGGLAADGMGELSKLLLGAHPAKALRLARDTGVLVAPPARARAGDRLRAERQPPATCRSTSTCSRSSRRRRTPARRWRCGSRRCCTISASRRRSGSGADHAEPAARRSRRACLRRLRYPAEAAQHVTRIVREHTFEELAEPQPVDARRFLARHGDRLALDLLAHKARRPPRQGPLRRPSMPPWPRFRELVEQELASPHRLADLAVDGNDLIAIGFRRGPGARRTLERSPGRGGRGSDAATTASGCSPARGSCA